ncbi:MAG: dihydrolipoyl dehydrogenase, partial [Candidatus Sumerlaeia bacterium]|nr:dihydrolipoyl dehydrogenase [Candidatus Sumerlaeia bacterium]
MSNKHFDLVVIGSGPGGYIAALKAAERGASTAIIERHPFYGGTCLNWGCIPSKALLATAELSHEIGHAKEMGLDLTGEVTVNWTRVQKRKDKILTKLRGGIKGLLAARKVVGYQGLGVLDGEGRVVITNDDGSAKETITTDRVILATGSTPVRIPGWPTDTNFVCTSDESLHWDTLPKKLLIVGGGVIGCEFACMLQPFGVDVTIVEMMPKLLPGMDGSLADELAKVFKSRGIKCLLSTRVEDMGIKDDAVNVRFGDGNSDTFDRVLVAVGRRPATSGIGLDTVGIKLNDRGFIETDDTLLTARKKYYAIGDANGKCLLAHAASAHGVSAVESALGHPRAFDSPIPFAVYTFPEVAGVGLTHEEAHARGIPISVGLFPLGHLGKAMAVGDTG